MGLTAFARLAAGIGTVLCLMAPVASSACGLRLVLAMDVSASVSLREYNLQKKGLAAAFRDREVLEAVQSLEGGLLVAVTQWAGAGEQDWSLRWVHITGVPDALAFAKQIEGLSKPYNRSPTAVGNALRHAADVLSQAPTTCQRSVVNVSADGATNEGLDTADEANALDGQGVTINALLILVKAKHQFDADGFKEGLVSWYARSVARGPGSFVMTTPTYKEYPQAIRKKLLREIRPQFSARPHQLRFAEVEIQRRPVRTEAEAPVHNLQIR